MSSRRKGSGVQVEEIQLWRGGQLATNLLSAFGQSLKETRLTALLGYILSIKPEPLMVLFGFSGSVLGIKLETRHEDGRSDILVQTSHGLGVIEAKTNSTDATAQARRYPARWRVLLTSAQGSSNRQLLRYVHWQQLADRLGEIARTASPHFRFLATQFNAHLEEHHMIKTTESLEIYARDINRPVTLAIFMKCHIYGCDYKKNNKVKRAQYFAPHFGAEIAQHQPGIFIGISYVAKVEEVFDAKTWSEVKDAVCSYRGKQWWNSHEELMRNLHRQWAWNAESLRSFLLLGEPRLAFNPPIRKKNLQNGKGWLSRQFFSFDDLFAAWGS